MIHTTQEAYHIGLGSLLKSLDSRTLKTVIVVLGSPMLVLCLIDCLGHDFANKPLEGDLGDK